MIIWYIYKYKGNKYATSGNWVVYDIMLCASIMLVRLSFNITLLVTFLLHAPFWV